MEVPLYAQVPRYVSFFTPISLRVHGPYRSRTPPFVTPISQQVPRSLRTSGVTFQKVTQKYVTNAKSYAGSRNVFGNPPFRHVTFRTFSKSARNVFPNIPAITLQVSNA